MDEETDVLPVIRYTFALTNHHLIEAHPTSLCYLNKVPFNKRCHNDTWLLPANETEGGKNRRDLFSDRGFGCILKIYLLICILQRNKSSDI